MPPTISAYAWKRTAQSVGELAAHKHSMQSYTGTDDKNFSGHLPNGIEANDSNVLNVRYTNSEGNNKYHNNIPPVFAIYIWKRTVQSVGELPSHHHQQYVTANPGEGSYSTRKDYASDEDNMDIYPQVNTGNTGNDLHHNNLPPAIATYGWKRIS